MFTITLEIDGSKYSLNGEDISTAYEVMEDLLAMVPAKGQLPLL